MKNETKGVLAIIGATILYSFEWFFAKELNKIGLNSVAISFGFILIALVSLYLLSRLKGIDLRPRSLKDLRGLILLGLFFTLNLVLFFAALIKGLVASALLINGLAPVWTVIAAKLFLKEKLTKIKLLSLLLAIVGLVLVFDVFFLKFTEWTSLIIGNMLALMASFFYAGRNIMSKKTAHLSEYMRTFWMFLFGAVILFFLNFFFPSKFSLGQLPLIIFYLLLLGLGIQMIAMLLVQYAFACIEASKVAVLLLLEVVTGSLSAWLIGGQILSVSVVSGGIFIILSCVLIFKGTETS